MDCEETPWPCQLAVSQCWCGRAPHVAFLFIDLSWLMSIHSTLLNPPAAGTRTDARRRTQALQAAKYAVQLFGLLALIIPNAYAVNRGFCML